MKWDPELVKLETGGSTSIHATLVSALQARGSRLPNLGRIERWSAKYGGRESSATDDTDTADVVFILSVAHPCVIVPWPRYQLLLPVAFPGYVEWSARPSSFPSESRQRGYWEAFVGARLRRRLVERPGDSTARRMVVTPSSTFLRVALVITEVQRNESYICLDLIIGRKR
ncbi:hypothetical protein C8F01DRAFT_1254212 [Mycena amicta]|nr:hypothetical protein C8F01DRAFT_1254212 [Mycena amicta]